MTTVYVLLVEDRHSDTEALVFTTAGAAIEEARTRGKACDRFGDYVEHEVTARLAQDGWVFYATYSVECDRVRVLRREVQDG